MASTKRRKKDPVPGWAWMLFGLSIGLAVALVVWLKSHEPLVSDRTDAFAAGTEPVQREETVETAAREASADAAEESTSAEQAGTDLSFFTDLPDSEVIVPGREAEVVDQLEPAGEVEFQVGSFPTISGADTQAANLALLGIESRIDSVIVDGTLRHRVIVGPLTERDEINRIRRRLQEADMDYLQRLASH